jgi:hypothetical protein
MNVYKLSANAANARCILSPFPQYDEYHWQVPVRLVRSTSYTHPGTTDAHPLATAYAGAKRRIAALEEQIQNFEQAGEKCKSYEWYSLHVSYRT